MDRLISTYKKSTFLFIFLALLSLYYPVKTKANVGLIEVRSTTSESYRCFASSLIMSDRSYDVAVNCAGLIYPPRPPEISFYVMWASPASGKAALRLGDLGKGEARFQVKEAFTSLYVTIEPNTNVRTPSKNIIMTGGIEPISFLRKATSPTPTLEPVKTTSLTPSADGNATTNTANLSTKDKLMLALKRAGVAAIIALVTIIGLVFVVTRSRG